MKESKNIDRLFQEKFKDFEVVPSEKIWDNIEAELNKKKKRRVIPFWFRLSGVAAALLIGLLIAGKFFFQGEAPTNAVVLENAKDSVKPGPVQTKLDKSVETGVAETENANEYGSGAHKKDAVISNPSENNPYHNKRSIAVSEGEKPANGGSYIPKRANSKRAAKSDLLQNPGARNAVANRPGKKAASKTDLLKNEDFDNAVADSPENKSGKRGRNHSGVSENNAAVAENTNAKSESNSDKTGTDPIKNEALNPFLTPTKENIANGKSTTNALAETDTNNKIDSTVVAAVVPNALEELLHEKDNQVALKEPKLNRWQITSSVAPVYFSSASNGSPLDERFESNKKNYLPTVAYGAGLTYAINKKLSVRSGISSVKLEYNTSDIAFSQTTEAGKIQNVNNNIKGSLIQVDNVPKTNVTTLSRTSEPQFTGSLNQKTGYIEVPVELTYKLLDKQFGVSVIGGLSTLFLNQNEVSIISSGLDMTIGEANNLNDMHFSTNVGVGFKYSFLKSFQANVEPMFKYQINTFSNDAGNFKPFFFGLYTGLSYRF